MMRFMFSLKKNTMMHMSARQRNTVSIVMHTMRISWERLFTRYLMSR